jgi:catalase
MTPEQRGLLFKNIAAEMAGVPEEIVQRQLVHFQKADHSYASGVAKALGIKNRAITK